MDAEHIPDFSHHDAPKEDLIREALEEGEPLSLSDEHLLRWGKQADPPGTAWRKEQERRRLEEERVRTVKTVVPVSAHQKRLPGRTSVPVRETAKKEPVRKTRHTKFVIAAQAFQKDGFPDPVSRAFRIRAIILEFNGTIKQFAKIQGVSSTAVTNWLAPIIMPPEVQKMLRDPVLENRLPAFAIGVLKPYPSADFRTDMARDILAYGLNSTVATVRVMKKAWERGIERRHVQIGGLLKDAVPPPGLLTEP